MIVARHVEAAQRALRPFWAAVRQPPVQGGQPMTADFMAGNPQEPPLPGFVGAATMERARLDRLVRQLSDARARAPGSGGLADRGPGRGLRHRGRVPHPGCFRSRGARVAGGGRAW